MTFDGTCERGGFQRAPQETEKIPPALRGEARCTTRLWVFGSLASDWLLGLPLQRPHIRLSTVQRNAYSMPCRANRFEPIGMTSELLGAILPILPSARVFVQYHVPQISLAQKAQNAVLHDQGAFMAWGKKEKAQKPYGSRDERNSWLREQRRSP